MIRIVTGTGYGVGKTAAAAALIVTERAAGRRASYSKPVEIGRGPGEDGDAEFVRVAASTDTLEGYRFESTLDPALAAQASASSVSLDWLVDQTRDFAGRVDVLHVESTGGFLTPLTGMLTIGDLASHVGADVVVVTRLGIGTLNAVTLTLEAIRSRALGFAGFVVNRWTTNPGVMERATLSRLCDLGSVLGLLPECDDLDTRKPRGLPAAFRLLTVEEALSA